MPKFAHMSDIHIGAFRQPELRKLVLDAFDLAIDECIGQGVSFVIMAGDVFDSNVPDLASVRRAAAKMKQAVDAGVRFYVVYGSHDFSPNYSSIVDVLHGAGLFTKAEEMQGGADEVSLKFVVDPSGAKICGISGKKLSIDRDAYGVLDRRTLEAEPGLKIFVFHGALEELKPSSLDMMEAMPASLLPAGFNYYAGGHVHSHTLESLPGRKNVAFPGPLFATDYSELIELAHGARRGFYLVEFDDADIRSARFIPVEVCGVVELHCSADGKPAGRVAEEMMKSASETDVSGKVVLLTVEGSLKSGRTTEVDLPAAKKKVLSNGALAVLSNTSKLSSEEFRPASAGQKGARETEREVFEHGIAGVKSDVGALRGQSGVGLALDLLSALRAEKKENETRGEFDARVSRDGMAVLGLEAS